jgi:hypothetical protein
MSKCSFELRYDNGNIFTKCNKKATTTFNNKPYCNFHKFAMDGIIQK